MPLGHAELIGRMLVGALLGGIIGYERDRHGRPVGLRTHVLVALSAATFMVVSSQFAYYQHFAPARGIEVDASRIAASVVSAIGFLAGGSILRTGTTLAGLTTAAGLWLVTAIGLCAGAGMYFESVAATLLGMLALTALRRFEDKDDRTARKRLTLRLGANADEALGQICAAVEALGGRVHQQDYERRLTGEPAFALATLNLRLPVAVTHQQLMAAITACVGLESVRIESIH
ncbi:MAG: MgtC/SapB family protein [Polyangiales bacterium]